MKTVGVIPSKTSLRGGGLINSRSAADVGARRIQRVTTERLLENQQKWAR